MGLSVMLNKLRAWRDRRQAMRELREIRAEDAPYEGFEKGTLIQAVRTAAFKGNAAEAIEAWHKLRERDPDLANTSATVMRSLTELKLYDVVDEALQAGLRKYERSSELRQLYAEMAQHRGDLAEAARRWADVRKLDPMIQRAYTFEAGCLIGLGRYDEAETLLVRAKSLDPDDPQAATQYAAVATHRLDWEEALRRWDPLRERFENVTSWIETARALRELGRPQEAVEILTSARELHQSSSQPSIELAWLAHRAQDWPSALTQWRLIREAFPRDSTGYVAGAQALRDSGHPVEEAEALLLEAIQRNETDRAPLIEYAIFAHSRGAWDEAIQRWAVVRERFPALDMGYTWGANALESAGRKEESEQLLAAKP